MIEAETLLSFSSAQRAAVVDSRRLCGRWTVSGHESLCMRQLSLSNTYAFCLDTRRPAARALGALALRSDGRDMTVCRCVVWELGREVEKILGQGESRWQDRDGINLTLLCQCKAQ